MADITSLQATRRDIVGKKVRALRRQGLVPANLFGRNEPSVAVQVDNNDLEHVLATQPRSRVLTVSVDGRDESVLVSYVQRHPTRTSLIHVDFHRISLTETVQVNVGLEFEGEAPAIRLHDGVVVHNLTEVHVEGMPTAIPDVIRVDLSALSDLESAIYVKDLAVPAGVKIVSDPEELVAKVVHSTIESDDTAGGESAGASETASA